MNHGIHNGFNSKFDFLLVIDFEAIGDVIDSTTWEIIEFPCVIIDLKSREIIAKFRNYVKPMEHKKLSKQCVAATKITQETVDMAENLPTVLGNFYKWIKDQLPENIDMSRIASVTCGDWDLMTMLYSEIKRKKLDPPPDYLKSWINIKKIFLNSMRMSEKTHTSMSDMLKRLKLQLIGQHHCGLDDCVNIARITIHLIKFNSAELNNITRSIEY
jgi:ERI1 exoribonuclease 3